MQEFRCTDKSYSANAGITHYTFVNEHYSMRIHVDEQDGVCYPITLKPTDNILNLIPDIVLTSPGSTRLTFIPPSVDVKFLKNILSVFEIVPDIVEGVKRVIGDIEKAMGGGNNMDKYFETKHEFHLG